MDDTRPLTPRRVHALIMQLRSGAKASSDDPAARRLRQLQKSTKLAKDIEEREARPIKNAETASFIPPETESDRLAADDLRALGVEIGR